MDGVYKAERRKDLPNKGSSMWEGNGGKDYGKCGHFIPQANCCSLFLSYTMTPREHGNFYPFLKDTRIS